jgi:hypothetical protein
VGKWTNEVEEDMKTMRMRNWRRVARNRKDRRRIVLDVKVHSGLLCLRKKKKRRSKRRRGEQRKRRQGRCFDDREGKEEEEEEE